jgi:hypothetical protein
MNKLQINIFTNELVWMGAVDAVETLIHRTSWHEILNSELTLSKTAQGVEHIQIGRILVVNNQLDKALIVEDLTASLDDNYITFHCVSLKGMLNYRIVHPVDSGGNGGTPWSQKRQSQVMIWMALDNLIKQTRDTDRYFWNNDKTKNMFQVAPTKEYGDTIDFAVDWDTGQMGDAITSVSKMFGAGLSDVTVPLGWNIYIKDDFSAFEMDVYYGRHKHINQTKLPPVVFSEEFGNIKNAHYEYSIKEWRNVVYTTWEDEEGIEHVETVGNQAETLGFSRKEMIYNSSKKSTGQVRNESKSELNKRPHVESFTAEIINTDKTLSTYLKDWDLGDIVTIQSKEVLKNKLISIDAQITGIEETYSGGEYTINATFGEGRLSVFQLIKQAIEQRR